MFQPPTGAARSEDDLLNEVLGTLGPVLDNPEYQPTRTTRR